LTFKVAYPKQQKKTLGGGHEENTGEREAEWKGGSYESSENVRRRNGSKSSETNYRKFKRGEIKKRTGKGTQWGVSCDQTEARRERGKSILCQQRFAKSRKEGSLLGWTDKEPPDEARTQKSMRCFRRAGEKNIRQPPA